MADDLELEPVRGIGFRVRLRYGKGLRKRFLIALTDEPSARRRAHRLRDLASMLARAGYSLEAPIILRKAAAVTNERDFAEAVKVAEGLCGGQGRSPKALLARVTFKELAEDWTSGRLHERWPDQVSLKRTADDDKGRLEKYAFPAIGSKLVSEITLEDCERVMRLVPVERSQLTRRHVAQSVRRLLNLAVYPLKLIDRNPIPPGFLPKAKQGRAMAYLYPDEDRRLLEDGKVSLRFRLFWGFLMREGMRENEAISLRWRDLDLERGAVRLDKNKTDDPRAWALDRGTLEALKAYRERYHQEAESDELVFVDENGGPLEGTKLPKVLRVHLRGIGLEQERSELFTTTAERLRIRVHDLRGTFVTVALANGKTEAWISDRTGHRSSQMIAKYKRTARTFGELDLVS